MDATFNFTLFIISVLVLVSAIVSKIANRFNVPALILFLGLGMVFGREMLNQFPPLELDFARHLGMTSLVLILFSGGMDSHWKQVQPILKAGLSLATLGVILTAAAVAFFAQTFLGLTWGEGFLLGSIVSSTDAAAVFSVLHSKGVRLKHGVTELLEFESGCNDPMAVFLTTALVQYFTVPHHNFMMLIPQLIWEMVFGSAFGYFTGRVSRFLIDRLRLETDGLYPVLTLSLCLITYTGCTFLHGNGFLAVYICGLTLGSATFIKKRTIKSFHGGIAWLAQIAMFLTLGLLVSPNRLKGVLLTGTALSFFLVFIARPFAVRVSMLASRFDSRQKTLISWVGLRGAVPIILAVYPMSAGIRISDYIFHLVFFVVVLSVLLQGAFLHPIARRFELTEPLRKKFFDEAAMETKEGRLQEVHVTGDMGVVNQRIVNLRLPENVIVVLIRRGTEVITPRGGTVIHAGDTLLIFAKDEDREKLFGAMSDADGKPSQLTFEGFL